MAFLEVLRRLTKSPCAAQSHASRQQALRYHVELVQCPRASSSQLHDPESDLADACAAAATVNDSAVSQWLLYHIARRWLRAVSAPRA